QFYLNKTPHRLEFVGDGEAAVSSFKAGDYDLVLMDVQMPVMDGLAATRLIRQWESEVGRRPAVIFALTASALRTDAVH
ncbi:response regulator, partial [Planctomycetota bacterium]